MAQLNRTPWPGFEQQAGEGSTAWLRRTTALLDAMETATLALPQGHIKGALIAFSYADGAAYYVVHNDRPLVLRHVPYADAWQVSPALIRGLRRDEVERLVEWDRRIARLRAELAKAPIGSDVARR